MEWAQTISDAVEYIEDHITEDITINDIAKHVCISPFYFQKGFSLLCGLTVMEYIRSRRLALAGNELSSAGAKVIDVALKYGYDSPDSFTRAFTRFHGTTPSMVQKKSTMLKSFAPLKIKLTLEGGYIMDYRITQKSSFTVIGSSKSFRYEEAKLRWAGKQEMSLNILLRMFIIPLWIFRKGLLQKQSRHSPGRYSPAEGLCLTPFRM